MSSTFVDVEIEPGEIEPDGLSMRFKCASPITVATRVQYASESGLDGWWRVQDEGRTALVEDSSEGTSRLVCGGAQGLVLEHESSGAIERVPYLLLATHTRVE